MAFIPRTYEEIRDDMISYIRMQTDLTDFEVGSVTRTIVEAAALEDDEQYFQMVQLLDAFRLSTASGADLDDRVEEYGLVRLQPVSSSGEVTVQDNVLVTSLVAFNILAAAVTVQLEDTSAFPTSGFPFTLRLGEGTVDVEEVSVSANDTGTNILTIGATTNAHNAGERASEVTAVADTVLSPGIRVQVPAVGTDISIIFVTVESGSIVNGNYNSTPLRARAEIPGTNGNVGVGQIIEYVSSPPLDGAGVTNLSNFAGGRALETDPQFRDRARDVIQSLSKGTVLALQQGVIGVADPVTGQSVTTSNILESFVSNQVTVFVDDGTGFTPDQVDIARSAITTGGGDLAIGASAIPLTDASEFPEEGFVIISPEDQTQAEVLEYSTVVAGSLQLVGLTVNLHNDADEVALVDVVTASAEAGQNFFQLANFPVVESSSRIWLDDAGGGTLVLQTTGTDYLLNEGTGNIEFTGSGVASGSVIVASYSYYTGLLKVVQTVIDGDPRDPVTFPGIRAAGINVIADTPIIRRIDVRLSITAQPGVQEDDLIPDVVDAVESYINALGIGDDVIVSEIIERAMAVIGMFDVTVVTPTSNTIILENENPVPFDTSGNTLVLVS